MDGKIYVLILDDSVIHTELLANALRFDHELEVASADSANDVIRKALEPAIEILVISATLGEPSYRGLEVLQEVRASRPDLPAVVLLDARPEVVVEAFRAGARGVFSRFDSMEKLRKCVRCVHTGQIWASNQQMALVVEALASAPKLQAVDAKGLNLLSKREMDIVQSLTEGRTNREIAEKLSLSEHTVKNYLFRIFDKVGVSSRVELLFMTLSNPQAASGGLFKKLVDGIRQDEAALQDCQRTAEQGSPLAQFVLAQLYWVRKQSTADIVLAYKWYLIASAQVLRISKTLRARMSTEQLLQADKMATEWLKENQRIPPYFVPVLSKRALAGD